MSDFKNPQKKLSPDKSREEALIHGRLLWEAFRKQFVNTPALPADLPGRFIALREKLTKEIKHPEVLQQMLDMVDQTIITADMNVPAMEQDQRNNAKPSGKAARSAKRAAWTDRAAAKRRGTRPGSTDAGTSAEPTDPSRN